MMIEEEVHVQDVHVPAKAIDVLSMDLVVFINSNENRQALILFTAGHA